MRLLSVRDDHGRRGASPTHPGSLRRGHRCGYHERVPMRRLSSRSSSDSSGCGADARVTVGVRRGETMTPKQTLSEAMMAHVEDRRQFFITTAAVGGALVAG